MADEAAAAVATLVLEGLSAGVLLVDARGEISYLNHAAEDLLGLSLKHARGRLLRELLKDGAEELHTIVQRCAEAEQPYTRRELTIRSAHNGGEPLIVDCAINPLDHAPGDLLVVEIRDATRRVRILRENSLLTQHGGSRIMIRQLAHEVKNPLGGLRGAAQLLERKLAEPELKEFTDIIIKEADRLVKLVDNLLGPGTPPRKSSINIHELLHHVRRLVQADAPRGVNFKLDYDPSLPRLDLDRDQIIQAMLNLVRNAAQSVGESGTITFRTRALTHYTIGKRLHRLVASIEIEDDGPGVPEDLRETLFYPFVTGRQDGTGLGLALAQELVNRHDGLIEYHGEAGRTVFQILLPMR